MKCENPPKNTISIYNSLIILAIFALSSVFMGKYAFQWAPEALDPSQNSFSAKRALKHWERLSVSVPNRHMSSLNYNQSYDYVFSEIKKYQKIADQIGILKISIEEQHGEVYESKIAKLVQIERDARNIIVLVELSEKNNSSKSPIMISAHIDGKNRGPAAYDDAAGIAAMLELLNLLVESKMPPTRPIIFLFVGVEELGLQGSKLFLKYFNCSKNQSRSNGCYFNSANNYVNIASRYLENSSTFLNIESLGPGMPLGIMQKGSGSAGTIYVLKNTKGLIFGTFADDVTKLGLIASTSDAVRFRENGFAGAELLFFGNPTKYHTQLDSISSNIESNYETNSNHYFKFNSKPINHLQLLGNSLTNYAFNYDTCLKNEDSKSVVAAVGISPFALVMNIKFAKLCGITFSFISIRTVFLSKSGPFSQILIAFLFELVSCLITALILLGVGSLHSTYNSMVYARWPTVSFNYLLFCGLFVYLFVLHLLTSPQSTHSIRNISPQCYQNSLALFNCILALAFSLLELDSSILFVWQLFFTNASTLLLKVSSAASFVANLTGFVYLDFSLFLLFSFMTKYTSLVPGIVGDLVPFAMTSISILFVSFAFTPFMVRQCTVDEMNGNRSATKDDRDKAGDSRGKTEGSQMNGNRSATKDDRDKAEVGLSTMKGSQMQSENMGENQADEVGAKATGNDADSNNPGLAASMIIVYLALLIIPLFLPPPYNSASYNIQGDIAHVIDPTNGSYVSFAPCSRKRVFNGVSHHMKLNEKDNQNSIQTRIQFEMPLTKYDVFIRNASSALPDFIKKWPAFSISVTDQICTEKNCENKTDLRNVVVVVPEENPGLTAINLVIECGRSDCVHNISSIGNIIETDQNNWPSWIANKEDIQVTNFELDDKLGYKYVLRVMPGFQPALFNFTAFGDNKIPMKITFTWDSLTNEAKEFLNEFPDFIQPFGRMRSIVDTTLVNYTYI